MSEEQPITTASTVNEAITRHPDSVEVFRRYGIDSCCGGALPIGTAAARHGLDADAVLREVTGEAAPAT